MGCSVEDNLIRIVRGKKRKENGSCRGELDVGREGTEARGGKVGGEGGGEGRLDKWYKRMNEDRLPPHS